MQGRAVEPQAGGGRHLTPGVAYIPEIILVGMFKPCPSWIQHKLPLGVALLHQRTTEFNLIIALCNSFVIVRASISQRIWVPLELFYANVTLVGLPSGTRLVIQNVEVSVLSRLFRVIWIKTSKMFTFVFVVHLHLHLSFKSQVVMLLPGETRMN